MSIENDETLQIYIEESLEHLADIENNPPISVGVNGFKDPVGSIRPAAALLSSDPNGLRRN